MIEKKQRKPPRELRCLKIARRKKEFAVDGECWNCPDMMKCDLIDDTPAGEKQYEDDRIY